MQYCKYDIASTGLSIGSEYETAIMIDRGDNQTRGDGIVAQFQIC